MEKKILINGMKCSNCAKHVKEALVNVKGISNVEIDLDEKCAFISLDCSVSDEDINAAINGEKYKVVEILTI